MSETEDYIEPDPFTPAEEPMVCVVCLGGSEQADCRACAGRGTIDSVPYCDRGWDEIIPRLWLGGHGSQQGWSYPKNEFDLVVSMTYQGMEFWPRSGEHLVRSIRDEGCDVEAIAPELIELAEHVYRRHKAGDRILIRCWAGLNRASLVTGLVLLRMGYTSDAAIELMREKRSPFVLFNADFVTFLRSRG